MVSRLLSALDARIARTRDPLQNDCLRAERATLLARQGRLDEARAELDRIRARHAAKPNAVVTAWVCLGEGMVVYYGSLGIAARDRFLRALALSEAAHARRVVALSAAWLAQMDFATQDFAALSRHLPHALKYAEPDQHSALSRACLVAAEAFHWAERFDLAMPWYARARHHATFEGDESMLSALMHNMAWLRVAEYRRREVAGELGHAEARQAKLSAESIAQFDGMVGIGVLEDPWSPCCARQVLILEGHARKRWNCWRQINAEGVLASRRLTAELAWCEGRHRVVPFERCGDSKDW
ncbi:MAG: hypothetical protein IPG91_20045 [Ideonella sp.]|nr:hypothetical protein [Ideonella sp.]